MSANKTRSSSISSGSGEYFPILLLGALGVGVLYYFYQNSDQSGSSGSFGSSSSGDWYDVIGGAATNSERAMSPAADTAGWGAGSASATGSTGAGSAGVNAAYIADVKKSSMIDLSGDYRALSTADINALNQSLANLYDAEGRSQSAFNFVAIPSNAAAVATVKNPGISNAGKELTSIVNNDGSYNVYDWRGNIVSSGSAGAFNEVSKKAASVSSSGSSSSGVKTGTIEGKTAVSSGSSSGKITGTAKVVSKKDVSSGSSGSSSSGNWASSLSSPTSSYNTHSGWTTGTSGYITH